MRFSIKSKFLAAARVKQKRREKCDCNSNVNGIKHNHFQTGSAAANERDNTTIFIWVNLIAADYADQRIALPNADEVS
jgi:hypothetical protein